MKKKVWLIGMVLSLILVKVEISKSQEITDEELNKYAMATLAIDSLKSDMKAKTNDLVKGNELMDKGRKFNAIKKANGDSVKLTELEITSEELQAYDSIQSDITGMKVKFKEDYTKVVKSDIGASLYNKVKKGLKSDEALKQRYDVILKELTVEPEVSE